jgi:hypothetical protein
MPYRNVGGKDCTEILQDARLRLIGRETRSRGSASS